MLMQKMIQMAVLGKTLAVLASGTEASPATARTAKAPYPAYPHWAGKAGP